MPKPGDRIVIDGLKIGSGKREGRLLEQIGSLIKVRWDDGSESLLTPGAGTVTYLPGRGAQAKASNGKKTPAKKAPAKAKAVSAKPARKAAAKGKAKKK